MKNVVVTGANGFVGAAVCKELVAQGYKVVAVVRNEKSNIDRLKELQNIKIIYCEMSQYDDLKDKLQDENVDTLFHFAWEGSAGDLRGDFTAQILNIQNSCRLMEACHVLQIREFVFASSIMEYEINALMNTEQASPASSLYSTAKVTAYQMLRTLANTYDITYIRGIISNIYGPGEYSPRLVNTSIRKLLNGEHCAFSPGEQMYDFIYIDDAAKEFVAIGEKGLHNKSYYIGSLSPKPLKDFLIELKNQVNPSAELGLGEFPFNGVSLTYKEFDIHAVEQDTGFIPEVAFDEGVRRTMQWIKEQN